MNVGGSNKPFKEISNDFLQQVSEEIDNIRLNIDNQNSNLSTGTTTAIVELENKATAKSHRPTALFNEKTCPFIGDIGYSKFLIEATVEGLEKLKVKIQGAKNTKSLTKALSTIKSITPYLAVINSDVLEAESISVRLFRYSTVALNKKVDKKFENYLDSIECTWLKHPSEAVRLYRIRGNLDYLVQHLQEFQSIQSAMSSRCIKVKPLTAATKTSDPAIISEPNDNIDYPVIAVVDSGVSDQCSSLEKWVVGRNIYIANDSRDLNHGTFVSGLISGGYDLNGQSDLYPLCRSKIHSVEVLGDDSADLYDILSSMHEVAKSNPHIKVWNLSLGTSSPVSMSEISTMALMLDEFQERYDCLCIISSGNYEQAPIRTWPPQQGLEDGVSSPGDSVRAITVGSIAHVDGFVKAGEPSSFSRRGPVSNFVQKPEVVHYGGNLGVFGNQVIPIGVGSTDPSGFITRDIGTSFSTPLISTIAANIYKKLGVRSTSHLVKALLIHDANLNNAHSSEHKPYYGWGKPEDSSNILKVNDYESTMVFEGKAQKSFEVQKLPFPIPQCLRTVDNKVRGEFFITLVYNPELDPNKAFEYCQIDLNVGFGKVENGKFTSQVPLQKGKHSFETDLVKSGDKWSPVKVYRKSFPQGIDVDKWKLRLTVLDRDGYEAEGVLVPFSIVITIRDIDKKQPVYNEMSRLMDSYNWEVSDLIIDNRIKV